MARGSQRCSCSSTLTSSPTRQRPVRRQKVDLGGDIWSLTMDMQAKDTFEATVDGIKERLETNDVLCCMSDYRQIPQKQLPATRATDASREACRLRRVLRLRETYSTASGRCRSRRCHGHHQRQRNEGKVTIVSDDKDMKTIPPPVRPMRMSCSRSVTLMPTGIS